MTVETNVKDDGITLLPCPFCGGEATVRSGGYLYRAVCDTCGSEGSYATKDIKAAKAWNRRHVETCHIVKTWSDGDYDEDWRYRCSECGCFIPVDERNEETGDVISAAHYCPNCGAKVVDE